VTDEQYKSIVGSRQEEFDFIEDDDGSGYIDQGGDDWENGQAEEEESEDEDDFEGEDEELRQGEYSWSTCNVVTC
jgi:DNA polymerase alpha subunit A